MNFALQMKNLELKMMHFVCEMAEGLAPLGPSEADKINTRVQREMEPTDLAVVLKMLDFVLKMSDCGLKMLDFAGSRHDEQGPVLLGWSVLDAEMKIL